MSTIHTKDTFIEVNANKWKQSSEVNAGIEKGKKKNKIETLQNWISWL